MREEIDEKKKVEEYRKKIRHNYNPQFYDNANKIIKFLRMPKWFFGNIIVEGVENVNEVKDKQLIYMSNHVSLADFLLQGHVFWKYNLPIPRILAGENLNRFLVGRFFKKCGAIFIDRNSKDKSYWRVEDEEIKNILSNKENLLIYPEGTRNDKLSEKLKTGSLGQLVDFVDEAKDLYIVPIWINYDKRVEERFINKVRENKEKRDNLKKKAKNFRENGKNFRAKITNFRAIIKDNTYFTLDLTAYIIRPFSKEKGNAYLNFGKAFSLKNSLENIDKQKKFILADIIRGELEKLGSRN